MALAKKEQDDIIKNKSLQAASKRRTATKVIIIVLIAALCLTGGAWGVMNLIEANSMKITLIGEQSGLALSDTSDCEELTSLLNITGQQAALGAHTYTWFRPDVELLGKEGRHSTSTYIAYSFFLKNVNLTSPCLYTMGVKISRNKKNLAAALRIMIIEYDEDDEFLKSTVYAQSRSDGRNEYIAYDVCESYQEGISLETLNSETELLSTNVAINFIGEVIDEEGYDLGYYAMRESGKRLSYNSRLKYTVVIWLEGTDLQCVNDILDGSCVIEVEFSIDQYLNPEYYG